jgi:uncharacterized membrane protein YbaN (DUF454 family)
MTDTLTDPAARVVHSSPGRLRVHCPDPGEPLLARLRGVPGVRSVEASAWTGNLLIQFDPRRTSETALLAELGLAAEDRGQGVALRPVAGEEQADGYVQGGWARLYKALGWSSVGMAVVGAATPGIPTAPFVLLAGYFFVRSSPTAHAWLLRSRWFGQILRDWEESHGVRRSVKYGAVGLMAAGLALTLALGLPVQVVASVVALEVIGLVVVARLPTVERA